MRPRGWRVCGAALAQEEAVDHRQAERSGFAGARLRPRQHVDGHQDHGNRFATERAWGGYSPAARAEVHNEGDSPSEENGILECS